MPFEASSHFTRISIGNQALSTVPKHCKQLTIWANRGVLGNSFKKCKHVINMTKQYRIMNSRGSFWWKALTFTDQSKEKQLREAKVSASNTLTWASLFAAIILIEPLQNKKQKMTQVLESVSWGKEKGTQKFSINKFLTCGYGIHPLHWLWHFHLLLSLSRMQLQVDPNTDHMKEPIRRQARYWILS
jgi:hypothetical protein